MQPYCRELPSHSEMLEVRRRLAAAKLNDSILHIVSHTANYSKCPLFPKPRKGTALKTNYTNTVNSIVRPNTTYAQMAKNTLHSANPQQVATPDTNTANISQHNAIELTSPAHIPTPSYNGYNECLNLITQTLQNTIQALTQLVQQINYLNVQNPTPPPTINKKNESNTKLTNSNIKKALKELLNYYEDDEE
ncbi:hypothetical protein TNCV_2956011 [Trichonephila clavipes]|nr:hypothetical protein TNCV_2956011 [Trichonephila clavipes]